MRKAESISAWHAEHGDEAAEEAYRRQALDPALGEICALGFAADDGPVECTVRTLAESERDFLLRALQGIEAMLAARRPDPSDPAAPWFAGVPVHPVGHNISGFDLGFLRARLWANRIKLPAWLPGPLARVGKDYSDTMTMFAGYSGKVSLDKLCRCLGIASPKSNGDGGAVFGLWRAGEHEALASYCAGDVEAVRQCWGIMTGAAVEAAA